jgi:chorismate mutase
MSAGNINSGKLDALRKRIDKTDEELLKILAERISVAKEIGEYKKVNNMAILQVNRWEEVLRNRMKLGETIGLDKDFLVEMFTLIHRESVEVQKKLWPKEQ